jgi:tRNA-(ms[2]io[6]A)-hydroxylase
MPKATLDDIQAIQVFLHTPTPDAWLEHAVKNIPTLLIDHAHCERKAAATALNFISKYAKESALVAIMSPLAREELLHFEKVMQLLHERNIAFGALKPSQYAQKLHKKITNQNYYKHLADELIIGAIIEARSCERFHALAPKLQDKALARFYSSLVKAEARHFQDYLQLAKYYCPDDSEQRIQQFLDIERQLILSQDTVFRFHGGLPPSITVV